MLSTGGADSGTRAATRTRRRAGGPAETPVAAGSRQASSAARAAQALLAWRARHPVLTLLSVAVLAWSRKRKVEHIIMSDGGAVQERESYGNDPRPVGG